MKAKKSTDYEAELKEIIARRYNIPAPEHINLDKAIEFEANYLHSPQAEIDQFLDKLEERRRNWRG